MKPDDVQANIWRLLVERINERHACAVATVLESQGSTPVKAGAKAILDRSGVVLAGTVGGGIVEATAQARAPEAIRSEQAVIFEIRLQGAGAAQAEAICGGVMRVLIDPTVANLRSVYDAVQRACTERRRGVVLTRLDHLEAPDVSAEWIEERDVGQCEGFPGAGKIQAAFQREASAYVVDELRQERGGFAAAFIEPVLPQPLLVIVGGGHVGQAVVRQAACVGFQAMVVEDREEFAQSALFPEGTLTFCGDVRQELEGLDPAAETYVVVVSRGHIHDAAALEVCIRRPLAYLGMIGSKRKVALLRQTFIESGRATAAEFDRVYAPIGLDIGAVTVPEIAASIVAQLISVRRRGAAARMPTTSPMGKAT